MMQLIARPSRGFGFLALLAFLAFTGTAVADGSQTPYAQFCCKRLMVPLDQNWHCYLSYYNADGVETTIGLHAVGSNPLIAKQGEIKLNAAYDLGNSHGRICGAPVMDFNGTLWNKVAARAGAYPNPSYYDGVIGPNSNSFAGYLGEGLPRPILPTPFIGAAAPALDHAPAPTYPSFLPLARHGTMVFGEGWSGGDIRKSPHSAPPIQGSFPE